MPSSDSPSKTAIKSQGLCGRADLVAALADGNLDIARAVAEVSGFDWRPPQPGRDEIAQRAHEQKDSVQTEQPPRDDLVAHPLAETPFWLPYRFVPIAEDAQHKRSATSPPYRRWELRPEDSPLIPPLSDWRELEPRLRRLLCLPQQGRSIDLERTVRHISRGHFLSTLPRERRRRWGPTLHVIEDRSRRLIPFRLDQQMVAEALHRLLPDQDLSRAVIRDGMGAARLLQAAGSTAGSMDGPKQSPGTIVLVLGDLGCLSVAQVDHSEQWLRFGIDLLAAGCTPVALIPGPLERCTDRLAHVWHIIPWERPRLRDPADSLPARAERLLRLVSPAVRIEPGLLRAARLLLKPFEADAGTEADVWQHPDLISRSAAGATLDPKRAKELRAEFASRIDSDLQTRLAALLRGWRGYLTEEIWFEELLNLPPAARAASEVAQDLPYARDYFADFALLCEQGADAAGAGDLEWFDRVGHRADRLWQDEQIGDDLKRLNHNLRGQQPDYQPPSGFDPALVPRPDLPVRRLALRQQGDKLQLAMADGRSKAFEPGSPLMQLTTRNGLVQIENTFWESGEAPPWADHWGRDDFGAWVDFSVKDKDGQKVTQRMRWIQQGSFLMGSPEDEPERDNDEGRQHLVNIDQGFWLFETVCTQALWQAVMGNNPSRFQGAEQPVEEVSWKDAQDFIQALNQRLPGFDLALPSEAQWEYACRAGTITPFSFGKTLTPERVIYDGNFTYAGSFYRQKTVPVATFEPNAWGLHEMHGNVWEWVQDTWQDNYDGAPVDGSVWQTEATGARRVIRGGSWTSNARECRSAYRNRIEPDYCGNDTGFRCALVQAREPGKQEEERARSQQPGPRSESGRVAVGSSREARSLQVEADAGQQPDPQPQLLRLDTAAEAETSLPSIPAFLIVTDRERLTIRRTEKPEWASAIGRDRFGLWTETAVEPGTKAEPVVQRLRWIPPGQFLMGSPEDEPGRWEAEGPQRRVTISHGYWLFDTPCTQALWAAVMGENPSHFRDHDRPVEQVSWDDAQRFLEQINDRVSGLELVLPSEAQWEHACRAGTQTALYTGSIEIRGDMDAPALDPIAWYGGNSGLDYDLAEGVDSTQGWWEGKQKQYDHKRAGTRKVKGKQPNPWGLYDMLGNVWEWVQDPRHENYKSASVDGSVWESEEAGAMRVVRGGSWYSVARGCRAAFRYGVEPNDSSDYLGFRCARVQS